MPITSSQAIEYCWPTLLTVQANNTAYTFPDLTVTLPETVGRTFRSVMVVVSADDVITATGGTVGDWSVRVQIDAVAYSVVTEGNDIVNTGENLSLILGPVDFAGYFQTNFTGASHTVRCQVLFNQTTGTTLGMTNIAAKIIFQYDYDDAATTRIQTVRLPIESRVGQIPITLTEIGTNQIPVLDTLLPEAGKVYRDIFFEVYFNEATTAATDFTLDLALDAETPVASGLHEQALISARFCRYIWKRADMTTNVVHALNARCTGVAAANMCVFTLVVTYTYDEASTTRLARSLLFPLEIPSPLGGTAIADASRFRRSITIPDANPTLIQSGVQLSFNAAASVAGLNVRVGGQAYRAYTHGAGSVTCGGFLLQHRFDADSAQGAGLALVQGNNEITIDAYRTDTTNLPTNVSGCIILNYTCDKPAGGSHRAPKTTLHFMRRPTNATSLNVVTGHSVQIPEAFYRLMGLGMMLHVHQSAGANGIVLAARVQAGEGDGAGWRDLYTDTLVTDGENGATLTFCRARDEFRRYPGDPDPARMNVETARDYRVYTLAAFLMGMMMIATYHTQEYVFADSVTGFSGDGSGITVDVFNANTDEYLGSVVTAVGGGYSFSWSDNVTPLYAVARQSATLMGRSDNGTAV